MTYDLVIIGGGSAGLVAAETSLLFKKKVAIVAIDRLGGDCLWSGCVPSKTLLHTAKEQKLNKESDMQSAYNTAKKHIQKAWDTIQHDHENPEWYKAKGIDVYLDRAEFIDDHTVQVGSKQIHAKYFLIATGSRALRIPIPGIEEVEYLTNESIFTLKKAPESLIVVGGGPIGCELGQAFAYLGSKVSIIQHGDRLIPNDDNEASTLLIEQFKRDGITTFFKTETNAVRKTPNGITLEVTTNDKKNLLSASSLLLAVGRQPNIENLGLDTIGIKYNKRGISHNEKLQTNKSHIYVAGDVAGDFQFTHFAGVQAATAVRNMFLPFKSSFVSHPVSWCTFTTPEIAHTGFTEQDVINKGIKYRIINLPFNSIDRAITAGDKNGLIKIIVKNDDTIIGATIVGERAGEIIHELALAVHKKMHTNDLLSLMHIYPTYSMGIQQALFADLLKGESFQIKAARLLSKLT